MNKFNRVFILFWILMRWVIPSDGFLMLKNMEKINNVEVILHTNYNYLFDKAYPDIIFTDISDSNLINNVDKKFKIDYGPELYYINNKPEPDKWIIENKKYDNFVSYFDYRKISLQSIAALILGLPYR